jgi:uncharacterized membrane protein YbhN (UPF0104 family)
MLLRGLPALSSPSGLRRVGMVLSLVCTALLLPVLIHADWREVSRPLAEAQWQWLACAVALALGVEVAKAVRWQLLLGVEPGRLLQLLALVFNTRVLNALTPLHAGDVWRVVFAARIEGRHLVTVGGSVMVEKLFDAVALGCLGLVVVGSVRPDLPEAAVAGLALLAGLGIIVAARRWPAFFPWLRRRAIELRHLRGGLVLLAASALTVVGLGLGLLVNLFVLQALAIPMSLTVGAVMLLSGYAAGLVPSAPGGLGVFELAVSTPLLAVGLSPAAALAAAVGLHLVLFATLAVGGLCVLPLGLLEQARERALTKS